MTRAGPKAPRPRAGAGHLRPPGALAWQEYEVDLRTGRPIRLAFMLADPAQPAAAEMKRTYQAQHLGLLVVADQEQPCIVWWFQQESTLTLIPRRGDTPIGDALKKVLPRYFAAFFDDIKDVAPGLERVTLIARRTGDRRLH